MLKSTLLLALLFGSVAASSQTLPPPSRSVYKCDVNGKAVYSDSPCVGATKIDIEPTRGLNMSSGKELTGADVKREQQREAFAEAIRPLTGMDAKQLATQSRRLRLTPDAQRECRLLDQAVVEHEGIERIAGTEGLPETQQRLFRVRQRSRDLGC
jgi:hypothetical protein